MKKVYTFLFVALLASGFATKAQVLTEDFENGIPNTWAVINDDDDVSKTWFLESGWGHTKPGNFDKSASHVTGGSAQTGWLITKAITPTSGSKLSFWESQYQSGQKNLKVMISTKTQTGLADFVEVYNCPVLIEYGFHEITGIDLSTYAGKQIYIGFKFTGGTDQGAINIDDIVVSTSAVACPKPLNPDFTNYTGTTATPSWSSTATEFIVQYKLIEAKNWSSPVKVTGESYKITGLTPATDYSIRIRSYCAVGDTSLDEIGVIKTEQTAGTCTTPEFNEFAPTKTDIVISWDSTSPIGNYRLEWKLKSANTWTVVANPNNKGTTISGLTENTDYDIRIQGICSTKVGDTTSWELSSFLTLGANEATICDDPTNFTASDVTKNQANIEWASEASSFTVDYKMSSEADWTSLTSEYPTKLLSELIANTSYDVKVQTNCVDEEGTEMTGDWSPIFTFKTADSLFKESCIASVLSTPTNITKVSANIAWTSEGTAFNIEYKKSTDATWTKATATTKSFSLTGLTQDSQYTIRVQTVCEKNLAGADSVTSAWSNDVTFSTLGSSINENNTSNLTVFNSDKQINIINNENVKINEVVVLNMMGQEVSRYNVNKAGNVVIDANLPQANYIVRVMANNNISSFKMFIK